MIASLRNCGCGSFRAKCCVAKSASSALSFFATSSLRDKEANANSREKLHACLNHEAREIRNIFFTLLDVNLT